MSIRNIADSEALRAAGETIGREGLAEYVLACVKECDRFPVAAMKLAGKLKAVAAAARYDDYWTEKVDDGYYTALRELQNWARVAQDSTGKQNG